MRPLVLALVLLAAGCTSGHPPPRQAPGENAAHAAPATAPALPANAAPGRANQSRADTPDLAGLSTAQRRAYEHGYRDCSQGRYAPANHLEAYRIGCAAAHDQAGGSRPQG